MDDNVRLKSLQWLNPYCAWMLLTGLDYCEKNYAHIDYNMFNIVAADGLEEARSRPSAAMILMDGNVKLRSLQ